MTVLIKYTVVPFLLHIKRTLRKKNKSKHINIKKLYEGIRGLRELYPVGHKYLVNTIMREH